MVPFLCIVTSCFSRCCLIMLCIFLMPCTVTLSLSPVFTKLIWIPYVFADGWAGYLVHRAHNLDRKLCGSGSINWLNWTSPVRCLERWQEAGHKIWGEFRGCEEANEYHTICSHSWWATKAAQRLLQGVYSIAIFSHHRIDFRHLFCTPPNAGRQLRTSLVGDINLFLLVETVIGYGLENMHEKMVCTSVLPIAKGLRDLSNPLHHLWAHMDSNA